MRTKRSGTIGLVVERVTNPFYPEIMERGLGLELERRVLDGCRSGNVSAGAGERAAIEAIKARQVDGTGVHDGHCAFTGVARSGRQWGAARPGEPSRRRCAATRSRATTASPAVRSLATLPPTDTNG